MIAVFCEECGGKNIISRETLDHAEEQSITCQICDSHMPRETLIPYAKSGSRVDTGEIRLLFIDDDPVFLKLLHAITHKEYKVSLAVTGEEGLKLAEQSKPDLIFLDIYMPAPNGFDICSQLKNNKQLRHIPIIFISAGATEEDELKGLQLGAVDYIRKPIRPQILHARIATHIRLQKVLEEHKKKERTNQEIITAMQEKILLLEQKQEKKNQDIITLKKGLDEVNQLVILVDSKGNMQWANRKVLREFDLTQDAITGFSCSELFCSTKKDCLPCHLFSRTPDESQPVFTQFNDALQAWISHKHIPVFDEEGEILLFIHLAELQTPSPSEEFISRHIPETLDLIAKLTSITESALTTYKNDKTLLRLNTYTMGSLKETSNTLSKLQEINTSPKTDS